MAGQEAQGLLAVWTDIAPEAEAEFNEWYNTGWCSRYGDDSLQAIDSLGL